MGHYPHLVGALSENMSPGCGVSSLFGFTLGLIPHVSLGWGGGFQWQVYNQKLVQYLNYIERQYLLNYYLSLWFILSVRTETTSSPKHAGFYLLSARVSSLLYLHCKQCHCQCIVIIIFCLGYKQPPHPSPKPPPPPLITLQFPEHCEISTV